jgi:hypothetical protein
MGRGADRRRFVVDLVAVGEGVEGTVRSEDDPCPTPFSGWLELLRLLEAHEGTRPPSSDAGSGGRTQRG